MTTFEILFWLLIVLIAVLAFTIESGLSARHRPLVLSSIMSATLAAVYMMFIVEDNSKFGTGEPPPAAKKEKQKIYSRPGAGDGMPGDNIEIVEEAGPDSLDSVARYEDNALLKKAGGFRDCPVCPLMTMIPTGQFIIGSPDGEPARGANEGPQKLVRFSRPFTISRYEIQYKEFAAFVREARYSANSRCLADGKPSRQTWKSAASANKAAFNHPVVCLTWADANAYANWLTKKTGRKYSLPSESKWEYAARGGKITPFWTGTDISSSSANFGGSVGGTSSVGQYNQNGFKLFDVAGNAAEMVEDCWSDDLSKVPGSGVTELGRGDCSRAPVRGGAWNSAKNKLRSAFRRPISRNQAFNNVGFRLMREIK